MKLKIKKKERRSTEAGEGSQWEAEMRLERVLNAFLISFSFAFSEELWMALA